MLRDLTIQNYRCFEDFQIDGLGQVNLFVGNNNSGKTSLLEAIYLLVGDNPANAILGILLLRGEIIDDIYNVEYRTNSRRFVHLESIKHIFYKYQTDTDNKLTILSKKNKDTKDDLTITAKPKELHFSKLTDSNLDDKEYSLPLLSEKDILDLSKKPVSYTDGNNIYLSSKKENSGYLAFLWNNVYLTDKEDKVVHALKMLKPNLERIGFFQNKQYNTVRLKLSTQDQPVPINSMGDGMYRLLTISIALVTAENGVLLVDEIETGLHYEAQTYMWRLVLETAKELNVQVFATTHSWDCITAYQEALSQVEDQSIGKLFRLDSKYGKLRAVEYDAGDLDIAVREGIEVR
ncbi:MAG: AAA family ATPase [Cyanobacteria bacterium P01_C01_bin.72]